MGPQAAPDQHSPIAVTPTREWRQFALDAWNASSTRAALAFFVARAALEEGHTATLFLAGDAVQLMRNAVLDGLTGVGTGSLREHYDKLAAGGAKFYLSGASSKSRGLAETDLASKAFEFGTPNCECGLRWSMTG